MKLLQDLRVGYVPFGPAFNFPGDRRRFCYYASKRNISFEIAQPSEVYDLVILTQAADISIWCRYPRGRTKIVFDFPDSYLSVPRFDAKGMLRGLAKFVSRQNRRLRLNYGVALQDMCRRADAVICCTPEQKASILSFCQNVHTILDSHAAVVRSWKEDYRTESVFHFVWEGLGHNLEHLLQIRDVLRDLRTKRPFLIHAITELQYGRFLGRRFGQRNTVDEACRIWPEICLYGWNEYTFSAIAARCDLALVPLPLEDPFCVGKPENRVLLFWRMGVPVLASSTPAHTRVMQQSGLDMALASRQEWREALAFYTSDEQARAHAGRTGRTFAETRYSEETMLALWDDVFRSVFSLPTGDKTPAVTLCADN